MMSHRSLAAATSRRSDIWPPPQPHSAALLAPTCPRLATCHVCFCIRVSLYGTVLLCPRALAATDWRPLASVLASGGAGRQSSVLRTGRVIISRRRQLTFS